MSSAGKFNYSALHTILLLFKAVQFTFSLEQSGQIDIIFFSIISSVLTLCDAREFSNERGRVERRAEFHKCRSRQMFTEAMSAYLSWITQAGVSFSLHKFP